MNILSEQYACKLFMTGHSIHGFDPAMPINRNLLIVVSFNAYLFNRVFKIRVSDKDQVCLLNTKYGPPE